MKGEAEQNDASELVAAKGWGKEDENRSARRKQRKFCTLQYGQNVI
jgi:hypothetical protein